VTGMSVTVQRIVKLLIDISLCAMGYAQQTLIMWRINIIYHDK
jgi:hypothetical protein